MSKHAEIAMDKAMSVAKLGRGLSKKDKYGNPYYKFWTKESCPEEHRQIVKVTVDADAEKVGVKSGVWNYDKIRKHSVERLQEIPYFVKFGAQLKFCISEKEAQLCKRDARRRPKGTYGAIWVKGSDRDGYYRAVTPEWKQERIAEQGIASPEAYHDLQRKALLSSGK